ncbi:helix-turn-helix transcriptional regulator [Pseudoalteromonas rubra]|uniref:helix-turn-helix transcriptional regulator n=1 Tax=Pseudoalteromonas rubra TaxID=43658 RepID=UPI000698D021|nr:helix-turn-helix transcriptional regulator [Pseudoalteromonas rubra]
MTTPLKGERERLNLTQQEVADKIHVGKATYVRWEKGNPIPSDKLNELDQIGFDILYVVTGRKSGLTVVDSSDSISIDHAVEVAKYAAPEAIRSVFQVKRLRQEVSNSASFDVMKSMDLIEKAAAVLARAEITGKFNTAELFEELSPSKDGNA